MPKKWSKLPNNHPLKKYILKQLSVLQKKPQK